MKDADLDIPNLRQAKAEYAKLSIAAWPYSTRLHNQAIPPLT